MPQQPLSSCFDSLKKRRKNLASVLHTRIQSVTIFYMALRIPMALAPKQFCLPGIEEPRVALHLSALVKSIRLRRTEDAIKWLAVLWDLPSLRYRITRRILVSSGEDGFSPELIEAVVLWYGGPHRYSLAHAAREVCRICDTRSWWAVQEGHEMIFSWKRAERIAEGIQTNSLDAVLALLESAISKRNVLDGLGAFSRASLLPDFSNAWLAGALGRWVEQSGHERAGRLFDSWRVVAPVLGRDTNISGLLIFLLLGGLIPRVRSPDVGESPVTLIANMLPRMQLASNQAEGIIDLPAWANDGIHARGEGPQDKRFAGVLCNFVAMCKAYDFYGRLDPSDAWLPEFYSCD
jgi:hypothetical protein